MTALKEGRRHSSPNAGYPEASFAGALQIKLGGPNYYFGNLVDKPYIGSAFKETIPEDIKKSCDLMLWSSCLMLVVAWAATSAIYF
jgi:adenosylcobinamide-phosphate synthase